MMVYVYLKCFLSYKKNVSLCVCEVKLNAAGIPRSLINWQFDWNLHIHRLHLSVYQWSYKHFRLRLITFVPTTTCVQVYLL